MIFENFAQLDDLDSYIQIVETHFTTAFEAITGYADCWPEIDRDRLVYAHGEYTQSIQAFSVLLDSKNPDQYKRAAALLYSLYKAKPIEAVGCDQEAIDRLEMNDEVGVSYEDCQHRLGLIAFYREYANEVSAFDLAFRCCDVYEEGENAYKYDFLHNMAYYLSVNSALSVASFAMIFKAFMA